MKKLLILFIFLSSVCLAQREVASVGQWQSYAPQNLSVGIAQVDDKIYCATQLGLFVYNTNSGEIIQWSKIDGLSDVNIRKIKYHEPTKMLFLFYANSKIDIIKGNEIQAFTDIYRKEIEGEKEINDIYFHQNFAFLSCSFGIILFDLNKLEIKESYLNIVESGEQINVFQSIVHNDSLFLATEKGLFAGNLSSNLMDYKNWTLLTETSHPNTSFEHIFKLNNNIYTHSMSNKITYRLNHNKLKPNKALSGLVKDHFVYQNKVFLACSQDDLNNTKDTIKVFNDTVFEQKWTDSKMYLLEDFIVDDKSKLWCATRWGGLIHQNSTGFEKIQVWGPVNDKIFKVRYSNGKIFSVAGGYGETIGKLWRSVSVDILDSLDWSYINNWTDLSVLQGITDVTDAVFDKNKGKMYFASHSHGLIVKDIWGGFSLYDESNSPMVSASVDGNLPLGPGFLRVTSLDLDGEGNLWISTNSSPTGMPNFHKLKSNGDWESFELSGEEKSISKHIQFIHVGPSGYKWLIMSKYAGGIVVYDDKSGKQRRLFKEINEGNLPDNRVRCMAVDLNGEVWVGTDNGIAVFPSPTTIFDGGEENDAYTPIFEGRPLLENQIILSMVVDGANRKWIGTTEGLYLFEDDGTELVHFFNVENSPLPINSINSLTIHPYTGEVFIGTDFGLLSYRSNATVGFDKCTDVKVFPNPVLPDYFGDIGISGLTQDAVVKVMDINGNLFFESQTEGGTLSWNLRDYNGNRAASGVYTVMVNKKNKKQSCAVNIVVIN